MSVVLYMINFMLIYINFNFDFVGLDNVDFENYFISDKALLLVF